MGQNAGRLRHFLDQWRKITSNKTILSWVAGYQVPLSKLPPSPQTFSSQKFSASEAKAISSAINDMLLAGIINRCLPTPCQFLSRIFLVNKSNGEKRFILNLKQLNKYVLAPHFKMEDYRTAS